MLSVLLMLLFGLSVAFSADAAVFSTLRFFEGFCLAGVALCLYLLRKYRPHLLFDVSTRLFHLWTGLTGTESRLRPLRAQASGSLNRRDSGQTLSSPSGGSSLSGGGSWSLLTCLTNKRRLWVQIPGGLSTTAVMPSRTPSL